MRNPAEFSTQNADYVLNPGIHIRTTRVRDIDTIDSFALERSTSIRSLDMFHGIRKYNTQYSDILQKNFSRKTPLPIFLTDTYDKYDSTPISELIGEVADLMIEGAKMAGPMFMFTENPSVYTFPLILPMTSAVISLGRGYSKTFDKCQSYLQLSNFYTAITGLRSASAARKIEEFVAPEVRKRIGFKPKIFIDYGAGHGDIEHYLKSKKLRNFTISVSKKIPSLVDKKSLDVVCELVRSDIPSPQRDLIAERVFNLEDFYVKHLVYKIK